MLCNFCSFLIRMNPFVLVSQHYQLCMVLLLQSIVSLSSFLVHRVSKNVYVCYVQYVILQLQLLKLLYLLLIFPRILSLYHVHCSIQLILTQLCYLCQCLVSINYLHLLTWQYQLLLGWWQHSSYNLLWSDVYGSLFKQLKVKY